MSGAARDILEIIKQEIDRVVPAPDKKRKKGSKQKCLYWRCNVMFEPQHDNHVWCSKTCGRRGHYLSYNVREMRKAAR
jgi:hypothetical protein